MAVDRTAGPRVDRIGSGKAFWMSLLPMIVLQTNTLDRTLAQDVLVEIRPVVLQNASADATATVSPPVSDGLLAAGDEFVLELWAQQTDPVPDGLSCVFTDLLFDSTVVACGNISPEAEFTIFSSSGSCDNLAGIVNELGGCSFRFPGPGIAPEWVRVATVTMVSTDIASDVVIASSRATLDVSIAFFGIVPSDRIRFSATPPLEIAFRSGDFNGDGDVDHADLAILLECMAGPNVEQTTLDCMSLWPGTVDLDDDLDVDLKDFVLFEEAVGRFAAAKGP